MQNAKHNFWFRRKRAISEDVLFLQHNFQKLRSRQSVALQRTSDLDLWDCLRVLAEGFAQISRQPHHWLAKSFRSPPFFAAANALCNLRLKRGRAVGKPFAANLINQQPLFQRAEIHQPVQRLLLGTVSSRDQHIDRQPAPEKVRRQHDHVRFVWTHPFG